MNSDPVFIEILQRWLKDFTMQQEQYIWGYIEENDYPELLYELKTMGYSYSIRQSTRNKGKKNVVTFEFKSSDPSDTHLFESPFVSLKRITLQCILGPNHHHAKDESETSHQPTLKKKRRCIKGTKKMGCPATILVRSVEYFSKYVVDENSSKDVKREVLRTLNHELDSESPPKGQIRYYLKVMGSHSHEPSVCEMNERIHPILTAEISKLVNSGVVSTRDIEIYLRSFVENMSENKARIHNKAFYPTRDVIYSHVHRALSKITDSQIPTSFPPTVPLVSILKSSAEARESQLLQAQQQLRVNLKYISDISYECNDLNLLNSCIEKLHAIALEMTQKLPSSNGVPLLPDVVRRKLSTKQNSKPLHPKKKPNEDDFDIM